MAESNQVSRRSFLAGVGAAGVGVPYIIPSSLSAGQKHPAANDRIQLGIIGLGARNLLKDFLNEPGAEIVALCDVWKKRLDEAMKRCKGSAKAYHDYRDLLQRDDIDAVVIGTPPHWHALQAIHACQAGKDIYLEKPMTMSVAESLAVLRAVSKHNRISQIGTQMHSAPNYRRAKEIIRSGKLGKINVVRTFNVMNQGPKGIGNTPDCDPLEGLDWDMWCGPGQMRPFNPLLVENAYTHGSFMYTGGWTPGMAPHIIDLPYSALELGHPTCVSSTGGRYTISDAGDAYDTQEVIWEYPKFTMTWMTNLVNSYGFDFQGENGRKRRLGIYFHGVNGTLMADYGLCKLLPEGDYMKEAEVPEMPPGNQPTHFCEWLEAIRTRKQPSCHVGYHYKIDVAINLAMLALKLGRSVRFDPKTETVVGDSEAAKLLKPNYRQPWKLPEEYL